MSCSKKRGATFAPLILGAAALTFSGCGTISRNVGKTFVIHGEARAPGGALIEESLPVRVRGAYFDIRNLFWPVLSCREIATATTDHHGRFAIEVPYYSAYKVDVGNSDERHHDFANFQTADYSHGKILIVRVRDDAVKERTRVEPTIQLSAPK